MEEIFTPSNIGLILDIFGVIIMWRFGLPSVESQNLHLLVTRHPTDEEKIENRNAERMSVLGIFLLIFGFILQIVGNIFY